MLACGTDNGLSGSVGELIPLAVSRVEVRRNEEAFQVTYFNNRGADVDVVARVAVALEGVDLVPGKKVPLDGEYAPGHLRTTVVHAPGGEASRRFPEVSRGDLVLHSGGAVGELTRGSFSMSFANEGGDLGQGRTLAGTFSAVALDGGFGP